jgi:hypothetical protein
MTICGMKVQFAAGIMSISSKAYLLRSKQPDRP